MAADSSTPTCLDIVSDTEMEISVSLEEATMKVVTSTALNDHRQKDAFHDSRQSKAASKRALVQRNAVDHDASFPIVTKFDISDCSVPLDTPLPACPRCYEKSEDFSGQLSHCHEKEQKRTFP